jgi:hypothetical protein
MPSESEFIQHPVAVPDAEWVATPSPAPHPAAPVCRAEVSLSPGSLKALGDMADHLPYIGIFLVLLALSVAIARIGRAFALSLNRSHKPD